ncbi:hypothetical protein FWG76_03025, partial [Candidatus Saccharibacteria bacterium]|nr:hypothetical protein [Candidatus Saccharibacteria bacterium]
VATLFAWSANQLLAAPWWVVLGFGWLVTPGMMFILGWVLESRTIPIGKGQSRGFFPGDFGLAVVLTASVKSFATISELPPFFLTPAYTALVVCGGWVIGVAFTLHDRRRYTRRAYLSPTKLYHDFGIICFYGPLIAIIALPALLFGRSSVWSTVALSGLLLWLGGLALDTRRIPIDPQDPAAGHRPFLNYKLIHAEDWKPFWK